MQGAQESTVQLVDLAGFHQDGDGGIPAGQARGAVAGAEYERNGPCGERFGNRRDQPAADVDVQQSQVQRLLPRARHRSIETAERPDNLGAEAAQHGFELEGHQKLVLDHEDAQATQLSGPDRQPEHPPATC